MTRDAARYETLTTQYSNVAHHWVLMFNKKKTNWVWVNKKFVLSAKCGRMEDAFTWARVFLIFFFLFLPRAALLGASFFT